MRTTTATITTAIVLLAGCQTDGGADGSATGERTDGDEPVVAEEMEPGYSEVCGAAVEEAAAQGDLGDAAEGLDPAIERCTTLDELQAAVDDNPGVLDVPAETWAKNRCTDPAVAEAIGRSEICAEVNG